MTPHTIALDGPVHLAMTVTNSAPMSASSALTKCTGGPVMVTASRDTVLPIRTLTVDGGRATLSAADATSGVAGVEVRLDDDGWVAYSAPIDGAVGRVPNSAGHLQSPMRKLRDVQAHVETYYWE